MMNTRSPSPFVLFRQEQDIQYQMPTYVFQTGINNVNDPFTVLLLGARDIGARPEFFNHIIKSGRGIGSATASFEVTVFRIENTLCKVIDISDVFAFNHRTRLPIMSPDIQRASLILFFGSKEDWLHECLRPYQLNDGYKAFTLHYSRANLRYHLQEIAARAELPAVSIATLARAEAVNLCHALFSDFMHRIENQNDVNQLQDQDPLQAEKQESDCQHCCLIM